LLFGIFPALHTSRPDVFEELKGGAGSSVSHSKARRFTSDVLVVSEIALSLLLLISSALLLKDLLRLRTSTVGVRPAGVWTGAVRLPRAKYTEVQQRMNFFRTLRAKLEAIPGVDAAAISDRVPLEGGSNGTVWLPGQHGNDHDPMLVEIHAVTPDYFKAMGVPLIEGRT